MTSLAQIVNSAEILRFGQHEIGREILRHGYDVIYGFQCLHQVFQRNQVIGTPVIEAVRWATSPIPAC